jgi:uncharacterized membrane protein (DUF373 family)
MFSMNKFLNLFEKAIIAVLIIIMVLIIIIATIVLGSTLIRHIITSPGNLPGSIELLDVFGYVLLILIGIELLATIKAYLSEHVFHVEIVLEVAMIAVARKIILLDYKEYSGLTILAIAALILALALGYYLEKRARQYNSPSTEPSLD